MSWHINIVIKGSSFKDEIASLEEEALQQNPSCKEQFEVSRDVVYSLIASGAIGSSEKKFKVVISGHSNPDHEPRDGWANDCVNISIEQIKS